MTTIVRRHWRLFAFARDEDPLTLALKNDRLRRNFQGYTTDQAGCVLGFGASAISTLHEGYTQNHSDFRRYSRSIGTLGLATARGIELDDDDRDGAPRESVRPQLELRVWAAVASARLAPRAVHGGVRTLAAVVGFIRTKPVATR